MTEREMLLKKIGAYRFAVTDMSLFLDTHPNDAASLKKREEYQKALAPLVREYEERFSPLTKKANGTNTWRWVKDPWPWDTEEND